MYHLREDSVKQFSFELWLIYVKYHTMNFYRSHSSAEVSSKSKLHSSGHHQGFAEGLG